MDTSFVVLLDRVCNGDQAAAEELVRHYEPVVRREVRIWLRRCRGVSLNRVMDSTDICQSVLARFFEVAADRTTPTSPEHLQRLLVMMARNRFLQHLRNHQAGRRDIRRMRPLGTTDIPEHEARGGPVEAAIEGELLELIRSRLSPEEREVSERRARGESWAEVVAAMGGTSDARRVQLARAEARVTSEFGLVAGSEP